MNKPTPAQSEFLHRHQMDAEGLTKEHASKLIGAVIARFKAIEAKKERAGRNLRPCPFCSVVPKIERHDFIHPEGQFLCYAVSCRNDKCRVRPSTYSPDSRNRSKTLAARAWNSSRR